MPNLNEMLTILLNRLKFEKKLDDLKQYATVDEIVKWKQLLRDGIEDKLKQAKYESTDQFCKDVEHFISKIAHLIHSKWIVTKNEHETWKNWADSIKLSMQFCLRLLDICSECFQNYDEEVPGSFTYVCKSQHKVVWAKSKNLRYWPAKVFKEDANWAIVQYFGTRSIARIDSNSIIDISEPNPNTMMNYEILRILQHCTTVRLLSNFSFLDVTLDLLLSIVFVGSRSISSKPATSKTQSSSRKPSSDHGNSQWHE